MQILQLLPLITLGIFSLCLKSPLHSGIVKIVTLFLFFEYLWLSPSGLRCTGLVKKFAFFRNIVWKNLTELFGPPNN